MGPRPCGPPPAALAVNGPAPRRPGSTGPAPPYVRPGPAPCGDTAACTATYTPGTSSKQAYVHSACVVVARRHEQRRGIPVPATQCKPCSDAATFLFSDGDGAGKEERARHRPQLHCTASSHWRLTNSTAAANLSALPSYSFSPILHHLYTRLHNTLLQYNDDDDATINPRGKGWGTSGTRHRHQPSYCLFYLTGLPSISPHHATVSGRPPPSSHPRTQHNTHGTHARTHAPARDWLSHIGHHLLGS